MGAARQRQRRTAEQQQVQVYRQDQEQPAFDDLDLARAEERPREKARR
jgi:hypothetical protein